MNARAVFTFLFVIAALALASCQKVSRDDRVVAQDDASYELWVSEHARVLSPAEVRELNEARQQIRFKVMQAKTGLPADEFSKAVYDELNGKTAREILVASYELQVDRVTTELANFQPQLKRFQAHDANRSLTDEERAYVTKSLETLKEKMSKREVELKQLKARLDELKQMPSAK